MNIGGDIYVQKFITGVVDTGDQNRNNGASFFLLYFVDILFGWYNVTTFLEKFVFAKRSLNIFILILNKRPFFIFYVPLPYITNLIDSCPNS